MMMSILLWELLFFKTDLTNESKHVACNMPLRKSGCSVYEKVFPFPLESSILRRVSEFGVVFYNHVLSEVGF
jgi:hypothetical protein